MPYKDKKIHTAYQIERKRVKKRKMIAYKGGKCSVCGYNKCPAALDFHHLNPETKSFNLGKIKGWLWEKIVIELDKCILVCSNCHREIEYMQL